MHLKLSSDEAPPGLSVAFLLHLPRGKKREIIHQGELAHVVRERSAQCGRVSLPVIQLRKDQKGG